jgi:hypothetical protein
MAHRAAIDSAKHEIGDIDVSMDKENRQRALIQRDLLAVTAGGREFDLLGFVVTQDNLKPVCLSNRFDAHVHFWPKHGKIVFLPLANYTRHFVTQFIESAFVLLDPLAAHFGFLLILGTK